MSLTWDNDAANRLARDPCCQKLANLIVAALPR